MKVLLYAQHLSGVGHHVRAHEIARALGEAHRVVLTDGGRAVPRATSGTSVERLALPRLAREAGRVQPLDDARPLAAVMADRSARLRAAAAGLAPDTVIVEHFPFSKWELADEIDALLASARAANPALQVVCSLRDVSPATRHESAAGADHHQRVLGALAERFDALIVHADPHFTRLEEHFDAAPRIGIPVFYSGFVCERARPPEPGAERPPAPLAVLSVGGGDGSADFALRVVEAWRQLAAAGRTGGRTLAIFAGLRWSPAELGRVRAAIAGGPFRLRPFGPEFLTWLAAADLSISRAGYNTCTNLLETGCPALLVPDPGMSDQTYRARRLSQLGRALVLEDHAAAAPALGQALREALRAARPTGRLDLAGARRTRELVELLAAAGGDLLTLARSEASRLADLREVTRLVATQGRRRGAFRLEFADGTRRKGRRQKTPARAERVARVLQELQMAGEGFPRVVARGGEALLLEWVEGPTLAELPHVPRHTLRRCGELLGRLHRLEAGALREAPPPDAARRLASLERHAALLVEQGEMAAELARDARAVAEACAPARMDVGLVHRDFCAENLVLGPDGAPVSIDNASLRAGPCDLDLARTWQRWPMTAEDRRAFAEGYEKHRGLDELLAHFGFWAVCILVRSAAKRLRMGVPGSAATVRRLQGLLSTLDAPGDAGARAYWLQ